MGIMELLTLFLVLFAFGSFILALITLVIIIIKLTTKK